MLQKPDLVLNNLKKNEYQPVYFLQGEEPFYIDQISNYIENHALDKSQRDFNQTVMYGKEHSMSEVLTNAKRFPMMSNKQVVIVKEAQYISDFGKNKGKELLLKYIQKPTQKTILVFCHKHGSVDKRSNVAKELISSFNDKNNKNLVLVNTSKIRDYQMPDWVSNTVKDKGNEIDARGVQMLCDYVGTDLERMNNEIDKILINFKEKIQITPEIIQKYIGISKEFNVFELQKALQIKDVLKANRIINYFVSNPKKNPVIPVIAMLYLFFSKTLMVHHAKDKSQDNLAATLKVPPFFVKDYIAAARAYDLRKTALNIHYINEADLKSKGVDYTEKESEILKELVFKLIH